MFIFVTMIFSSSSWNNNCFRVRASSFLSNTTRASKVYCNGRIKCKLLDRKSFGSSNSHLLLQNKQNYESRFLDQIEETIHKVFQKHNIHVESTTVSSSSSTFSTTILNERISNVDSILESIHPISQREEVGVAIHLYNRIFSLRKNNDCRRCWLQKAHCICDLIPSFEKLERHEVERGSLDRNDSNEEQERENRILLPTSIKRIFLVMHHKEICMAVDTAKLLLGSFDQSCRLVIAGLNGQVQSSMNELIDAVQQKERKCMVLFPADDALTFQELNENNKKRNTRSNVDFEDDKWDVIVIDGTWAQARKMYSRYIPRQEDGGPHRVCLSKEAVDILGSSTDDETITTTNDDSTGYINTSSSGRQLRRHPIKWREVSTLEATRLMIRDVMLEEVSKNKEDDGINLSSYTRQYCFDVLSQYQVISDNAARKQLGAPRLKRS